MSGHVYSITGNGLSHCKPISEVWDWMESGDVIIVYKGDTFSKQNIAQTIASAWGTASETKMSHAAIVGENPHTNEKSVIDPTGAGILQLNSDGFKKLWVYNEDRNTSIHVWRCGNRNLRRNAGTAAWSWSSDIRGAGGAGFTTSTMAAGRMIKGALGYSGVNNHSVLRAMKYAALKDSSSPTFKKGLMCSTFVVACYQAAALSAYIQQIEVQSTQRYFTEQDGRKKVASAGQAGATPISINRPRIQNDQLEAHLAQGNGDILGEISRALKVGGLASLATPAMASDAKHTGPGELYAAMAADRTHWRRAGFFSRPKCCVFPRYYLLDDDTELMLSRRLIAKGSWALSRTRTAEVSAEITASETAKNIFLYGFEVPRAYANEQITPSPHNQALLDVLNRYAERSN